MPEVPGVPSNEIAEVAEEFAEGVLRRSPTTATSLGDRRFDDRLPDIGPSSVSPYRSMWGDGTNLYIGGNSQIYKVVIATGGT